MATTSASLAVQNDYAMLPGARRAILNAKADGHRHVRRKLTPLQLGVRILRWAVQTALFSTIVTSYGRCQLISASVSASFAVVSPRSRVRRVRVTGSYSRIAHTD